MERYDLMNAVYQTIKIAGIDKARIWLISRDAQRVRARHYVDGFVPHFFAPTEEDTPGAIRDLFDRPVLEIQTSHPSDVKTKRAEFPFHDEADIQFWVRYLVDKKITCGYGIEGSKIIPQETLGVPMFTSYFDIEVETPPEIMAKPEDPKYPIVSMQFSNNYDDKIILFMLDTKVEGVALGVPPILKGCTRACTGKVRFKVKDQEIFVYPVIYHYDNEVKMIEDFISWFVDKDFDTSTGWNSNLFDWPYLIKRCERLHIDHKRLSPFKSVHAEKAPQDQKIKHEKTSWKVNIKGITLIDLLEAYKKWSGGRQPIVKGRPFGLTYDFHITLEYECGFFYVDLGDKVKESRTNHPYDWVEYCTGDAFGLRLLDSTKRIIGYYDRYRRVVGVPLDWALANSRLIDMRLLRLRDRPLPSKVHHEKKRVPGAIVFQPDLGVHKNIAYVDVKSLYPTLFVIYNLSPETIDPKGDIRIGPFEDNSYVRVKSKPVGILPKAVLYDMAEREKYRKELQRYSEGSDKYNDLKQLETLHKFLACSYYGYTGYENARLYSDDVRKCITFLGREALKICKSDLEKEGFRVRYGDTDSLFIQLNTDMPLEGRLAEAVINKTLKRIAWKHGATLTLEAKYEHWCRRIIFVPKYKAEGRKKKFKMTIPTDVSAKKRYAYTNEQNQLFIVGMAPRRSSTAALTRSLMMDWLFKVLVEDNTAGALKIIRDSWKNIQDQPLNQIGLPKGLHKDVYMIKSKKTGKMIPIRNPWHDGVKYMVDTYGKIFRQDKKPLLIYMKRRLRSSKGGFRSKEGEKIFPVEGVCITENDTTLPAELQPWINWNRLRNKVIRSHFEPLFKAINIPWEEVILESNQQGGKNYWEGFSK